MRELFRPPGVVRRPEEGGLHAKASPAGRGQGNVRLGGLAIFVLSVAGCTAEGDYDHLDRQDRISHRAGDTQARNMHIQAVNPVPPEHAPPPATYDGQRALLVMGLYYDTTGVGPGADAAGTGAADGEAGL